MAVYQLRVIFIFYMILMLLTVGKCFDKIITNSLFTFRRISLESGFQTVYNIFVFLKNTVIQKHVTELNNSTFFSRCANVKMKIVLHIPRGIACVLNTRVLRLSKNRIIIINERS